MFTVLGGFGTWVAVIYAVTHDVGDKPQKDKTWVASAPGVGLALCGEEDVALDSLFGDTLCVGTHMPMCVPKYRHFVCLGHGWL